MATNHVTDGHRVDNHHHHHHHHEFSVHCPLTKLRTADIATSVVKRSHKNSLNKNDNDGHKIDNDDSATFYDDCKICCFRITLFSHAIRY